MSNVKIGENQVFGIQEFNRVIRFHREDSSHWAKLLTSFGIFRTQNPTAFNVLRSNSPTTDYIISAGEAIDSSFRRIHLQEDRTLSIPAPATNTILYIEYAISNAEQGLCSINAEGVM